MTLETDTTDRSWVGPRYRAPLPTQTYAARPRIDGVRLLDLKLFGDEGGDFCEIARLTADGHLEAIPAFRPAQMSYSLMEPGSIKAMHLHRRQEDVWFVLPCARVLVGLLDVRDDSPTYDVTMRLALGAGRAQLLHIPRGVAHGVANLSTDTARIMYLTNQRFDPEDPDEHRLPFDLLGADFWTMTPG